jgi:hypothetical protein
LQQAAVLRLVQPDSTVDIAQQQGIGAESFFQFSGLAVIQGLVIGGQCLADLFQIG